MRLYHFVLSSYNPGRSHISKLGCPSFLLPFLLPFLYPFVPPPCFPTLCLFLPFFLSLCPWLSSFLNPSLPSSLFCPLFSLFFLFLSRGPAAHHLKPARGVKESCEPGRQTDSVHSEVKIGFWWVVTAVLKKFTYDERQLQVTRETKILGVGHSIPIFWVSGSHDTQNYCVTVYGIKIKTIYLIILLLQITDSRNLSKFPSSSIFNCVNVCFCFNSTLSVDLAI